MAGKAISSARTRHRQPEGHDVGIDAAEWHMRRDAFHDEDVDAHRGTDQSHQSSTITIIDAEPDRVVAERLMIGSTSRHGQHHRWRNLPLKVPSRM